MARTFMQLITGAMDNFARVKELQTLLSVALNEADSPSEEACKRIALLVDTYLCQVEPWIEDLNLDLERSGNSLESLVQRQLTSFVRAFALLPHPPCDHSLELGF